MCNTAIGEALISAEIGGAIKDYLFRPSFYNLQKLGEPVEIKQLFKSCLEAMKIGANWQRLNDCIYVLVSFCDDDLPVGLVGEFKSVWNQKAGLRIEYKRGKMSAEQIVILANHLLKWALIGDEIEGARRGKSSGDELEAYDPRRYVAAAQTHLNVSSPDDAWNMTMTEFKFAIDAMKSDEERKKESATNLTDEELAQAMRL